MDTRDDRVDARLKTLAESLSSEYETQIFNDVDVSSYSVDIETVNDIGKKAAELYGIMGSGHLVLFD